MMGQLKTNPKVYERMIDDGYADDEIPLWVARPSDEQVPRSAEQVPRSDEQVPRSAELSSDVSNTLNSGGAVSTAEYNTLDQLNIDQLAQMSLIRMPNGTIGRLQQLQGGSMRFDPLEARAGVTLSILQ
jgi:hypothetical protein